ncbi:hypothetical protein QDA02_gp67 [Microbacterium phage Margaery]|uniref:Uncharacterized protein n=1 Tax=Microbacterium phage Margaery TaxID=2591217 RepID=A0A514DHJ8_9CAUD|nr:hypothetical protein QDA02_gp67 [Microbacterium phage Margaery]QDH93098.1 hypothetical protein PBI_MARGAERY_41 [Microbacterium phage Margaery]
MNLTINVLRTNSEQMVTVGVTLEGEEVMIGREGITAILQAWTDGPSKSWQCENGYLTVTKDGRDYSASADDMGLWSLEAIEFLTRHGIQYAEGIGDPSPKVQHRIQELLAERGMDMPEARVVTNAIVGTLAAEGLL